MIFKLLYENAMHSPIHGGFQPLYRVVEKECRDYKNVSLKNCWTYRNDSSVKMLRNVWSFVVCFDMCSICLSADIKTVFDLVPSPLNYPVGATDPQSFHHTHSSWRIPQKKSIGVRSRLLGGQGIGPPFPIQALGNFSFKAPRTGRLKWGGVPSCMKMTRFPISLSLRLQFLGKHKVEASPGTWNC
jgi:hypothetical protein